MKKIEAIEVLMRALTNHKVVVCNGMIGREVFSVKDSPSHFYMIGSMGIAPAIALGIAHSKPDVPVCVIEGDGNSLMGLGNIAQIAFRMPKNLVHITLDNGVHASTGGQKTLSKKIPLHEMAKAAGYSTSHLATTLEELKSALLDVLERDGPTFIQVIVEPGTVAGIPRIDVEPPELTRRFRESITGA